MFVAQQILLIAASLCFLTFLALLSVAAEKVRGMRAIGIVVDRHGQFQSH